MPRPTHAEINLEAVAHNLRVVRAEIGPDVRILAAVKADAYGHGAVAVSETALAHGADYLGVATVEEGIELRHARVDAPILVFTALATDDVAPVIQYRLIPALTSLDFARTLDHQAAKRKKHVKVHLKIDSGMGRIGFLMHEAADAADEISRLPHLLLEGVMTHFPSSDEKDKTFTRRQIERFRLLLDDLRSRGIQFPIVHTANSAAIFELSESLFNMVRLGVSLYGYLPTERTDASPDLRPSMTLKTRIVHLKQVGVGTPVSYGRTFVTARETLVATVPIGYADGIPRELSNRGKMIVHASGGSGVVAPIIGRVCMDQTMLDVTDVPDVNVGSDVTVYSARREDPNSVESTARLLGTIPHTVTCAISRRVPRIYLPAHPPRR
jgi:alanine racemase